MDDNQLDRLFQQELQDYQASSQGADANWERLQGRMAVRRRASGWWIWLIGLLLLSGGLAVALTMVDWAKEANSLSEGPDSPAPPLPLAQRPASSDQTTPPHASAIVPASPIKVVAQKSRENLPPVLATAQVLAPSSGPAPHASTRGDSADPLLPEVIPLAQATPTPLPLVASPTTTQAIVPVADLDEEELAVLPSPQIRSQPVPVVHEPWRWLPCIGVSIGWQQSQPTSGLIQPWPLGVRAVLVEKGPFALEGGVFRDRYRLGTDFRSQAFRSSTETVADFELGAPPELSNAPPPDTQMIRQLRIDAPGVVLPLGVTFSPKLSSRWQPLVQAGMLLRYQFEPNITGEYHYVVQSDSSRFSPITPSGGNPPVLVNDPDTDTYRGWQVSGWQAGAGVCLRLHPHLSAQLEGYYQSRRAFDLPEQQSFQTIGIRATLWWMR